MDDVRTLFVTILIDIVHIKLLSKKRIPLDCDHCVFLTIYVLRIDINLRSVECCFSDILYEWNVEFLKHCTDMTFCLFPYFRCSNIFLSICWIPFRKVICYILFYSENLQTVLCKCDTIFELFYHLIWSYY